MIKQIPREKILLMSPALAGALSSYQQFERTDAEEDFEQRCDPVPATKPVFASSFIFTDVNKAHDVGERIRNFAKRFVLWFQKLTQEDMLVAPYLKGPWHFLDNSHPQVRTAQTYMKNIGAGPTFEGGLTLSGPCAEEFLVQLQWIVRGCPEFPYIAISAKDLPIVITLCQYINVHCEVYHATHDIDVVAAAASVGWTDAPSCETESNIEERRFVLHETKS